MTIAAKPRLSGPFSKEIPELFNVHLDHLKASAIPIDVIRERGYISVLGKKVLVEAGFSPAQQRPVGILIPLHGVNGDVVGHQYRPDNPREDKKRPGRFIKYDNPRGSSVRIDVPPRCHPSLGNPAVPLWITEGVKKVDSLAGAGACAIGLIGVWGFKGKNNSGGITLLADWDLITLKDRLVYVVYDSDSSSNPHVRMALDRLAEHLRRRGGKVRIIQLPPGPDDEKVGADDYLAAGHTLDDLIGLEVTEVAPRATLKEKSSDTYFVENGRICWRKQNKDGETIVPLCNFNARVTEDIIRDNGLETTRYYKVVGTSSDGTHLPTAEVTDSNFSSLSWVTKDWGIKARILAGQNTKDRLRYAIQLQSEDAEERSIFTHTGWRHYNGRDVYLSQGGAIGCEGVDVDLDQQLQRYFLPQPDPDKMAAAVKASVDFLYTADLSITLPLWAAMYLAPLGEAIDTAFTLWVKGPSGCFKSTLVALALSHYGEFDQNNLPAAWNSTANKLLELLFLAKDIPLVIDDWVPGEDSSKQRDHDSMAGKVIRAQGNRQGRGRMNRDSSSQAYKPPRGFLIVTGEQLLSGHSANARIFVVDMEKKMVDLALLTQSQREARQGLYRQAMAHYISWLQPDWLDRKLEIRRMFSEMRIELAAEARERDLHPRLPDMMAMLCIGLNLGFDHVARCGVLSESDVEFFRAEGRRHITEMAIEQGGRVQEERPGQRAIKAVRAALRMGTAILRNKTDLTLANPGPYQVAIGWRDYQNGYVLLDLDATHQVIVQHYEKAKQPYAISPSETWKDFVRLGYSEPGDAGRSTVKTRITAIPQSIRVVKMKSSALELEIDKNSDKNDD